jgi:hypothetical protein
VKQYIAAIAPQPVELRAQIGAGGELVGRAPGPRQRVGVPARAGPRAAPQVQAVVHGQSVQPGRERGVAGERVRLVEHAQEDLLRRIVGVRMLAQQVAAGAVHAVAEAVEHRLQRAHVAALQRVQFVRSQVLQGRPRDTRAAGAYSVVLGAAPLGSWRPPTGGRSAVATKSAVPALRRCRPRAARVGQLHVEALLVRHELAVLEMAPQQPEVDRPAVARDPPVLVGDRPARVMEADQSQVAARLHPEPDARAEPVSVRLGHLQLELGRLRARRHPRAPVEAGTEAEGELRPHRGPAGRLLRPPCVQALWRADGVVDALLRRSDLEITKVDPLRRK